MLSTWRPKHKNPHRTPLDSHPSCRRSRPRHHTSSPGAYKECCCTGTRPGGSVYPLTPERNTGKVTSAAARLQHLQYVLCAVSLLPPLSHSSSSLPSKQSASASQCHRSGMQWPFLHWYWSLSHFTSQPFYGNTENCALAPRATVARGKKMCDTSSDPSAQSWSPSHFQRPAMQRPFAQANSLSEHWRGTGDRGGQSRRRNNGESSVVGKEGRSKERCKHREEKVGSRADCKSMNNKG